MPTRLHDALHSMVYYPFRSYFHHGIHKLNFGHTHKYREKYCSVTSEAPVFHSEFPPTNGPVRYSPSIHGIASKSPTSRKQYSDGIVFDAKLDDAAAERFVIYPLQKNLFYMHPSKVSAAKCSTPDSTLTESHEKCMKFPLWLFFCTSILCVIE